MMELYPRPVDSMQKQGWMETLKLDAGSSYPPDVRVGFKNIFA